MKDFIKKWLDTTHCIYCNDKFRKRKKSKKHNLYLTRDHIVPISKGGNNDIFNKLHCCSTCNGRKSNMLLEEWEQKLSEKTDLRSK